MYPNWWEFVKKFSKSIKKWLSCAKIMGFSFYFYQNGVFKACNVSCLFTFLSAVYNLNFCTKIMVYSFYFYQNDAFKAWNVSCLFILFFKLIVYFFVNCLFTFPSVCLQFQFLWKIMVFSFHFIQQLEPRCLATCGQKVNKYTSQQSPVNITTSHHITTSGN